MNKPIRIDCDTWFDTYKPINNPHDEDAIFEGTMFETYDEELAQVEAAPRPHVWTYVDDDDELVIKSGFHRVDRHGYFITEAPWSDDMVVDID